MRNDDYKKINPVSVSSADEDNLHFNEEYSVKQFYYTLYNVLREKAGDLKSTGLITKKIYDNINNLASFSDLYEDNLYKDEEEIEDSDLKLLKKLDGILEAIFGYNTYALLKSGLLTFELDANGINRITCIAPDTSSLHKILQKTRFITLTMSKKLIIKRSFRGNKEEKKLFFISILLNGHKQVFKIRNSDLKILETIPENPLGFKLYPTSSKQLRRFVNEPFLNREYNKFLQLFAGGTASDFIVSGKNLIFRKVCKMVEDHMSAKVTMVKIKKDYHDEIEAIKSKAKVSESEAIIIVKQLLIDYLTNHYLDYLYFPLGSHDSDYNFLIYQMLEDKKLTKKLIHPKYDSLKSNFLKEFELIFNLKNLKKYFTDREILEITATLQFSYYATFNENNEKHKPAWTLSVDSIMDDLEEPILKTYDFLSDIFENYPEEVRYFSIYFHRSSPSGPNNYFSRYFRSFCC